MEHNVSSSRSHHSQSQWDILNVCTAYVHYMSTKYLRSSNFIITRCHGHFYFLCCVCTVSVLWMSLISVKRHWFFKLTINKRNKFHFTFIIRIISNYIFYLLYQIDNNENKKKSVFLIQISSSLFNFDTLPVCIVLFDYLPYTPLIHL